MGLGASFCWTRLLRVQLRDEGFTLKKIVRLTCLSGLVMALAISALAGDSSDARLQKAYRFQQGGWTYVHLEGSPADLGYQHGYLLAPEVQDAFEAIKLFESAGIDGDWHPTDLRRSFASLVKLAGRDIAEIAADLGHRPGSKSDPSFVCAGSETGAGQ